MKVNEMIPILQELVVLEDKKKIKNFSVNNTFPFAMYW